MTKKKHEKVTEKAPAGDGIILKTVGFFKKESTRFILGMIVLFFTAFLFLSFLSFFFTGDADQCSLENLPLSQLTDVSNEIQNWTGFVGAYTAELFINRWLGISSFMICLFLGAVGLRLINAKKYNLVKTFLYTNTFMLWGSLFFGFFFISGYEDSFLFLGGAHGYYMTLMMKANVGWFGTFLIISATFLSVLILINNNVINHLRNFFVFSYKMLVAWLKKITAKKPKPIVAPASVEQPEIEEEDNFIPDEINENINPHIIPDPNITEEVFDDNYGQLPYDEEPEVIHSPVNPSPEMSDNGGYYVVDEDMDEVNHHNLKPADFRNEPEPEIEEIPGWISQPEDSIPEPVAVIEEEEEEADDSTGFVVKTGEEDDFVNINELGEYDPTLELSKYKAPTLELLNKYDSADKPVDMDEQNANKQRIEDTLRNYGIEIQTITATVGPTITLYEIVPKQGVRISKIKGLEDDIALSLAALGIRIIAPIPGKGTVGIEVPNKDSQIVSMHSVIASRKFQECKFELPVSLGKTITNDIFMFDLAKMPHLLVAGATGQGKSVGLNAIITSLLYKKHPSQLKFVLIDPKKVEFNIYSAIERHFLAKLPDAEEAIITDVTKVVATLNSICKEMDDRYDLLKMANTRNIKEYNGKFQNRVLNPEKGHRYMPYMVVIVDEFGDLIMTAGKEVELPIARIAQLARAVGIHMIIATQRPSTNIITGIIKANFPARIGFRVSSMIDSRTILDSPGANQLIGRGDLLFAQGGEMVRVQCAFVDTPEVEKVSEFIGNQMGYATAFLLPEVEIEGGGSGAADVDLKDRDPMFEEAARMVVGNQQGSTSMIQRKFSIGYNRAGRIMDQLEAAGIVGPFEGSKARSVLVMDEIELEHKLDNLK